MSTHYYIQSIPPHYIPRSLHPTYRRTAATAIAIATPLPTFFAAPPVNNGSVPVVPLGETGTRDAVPVGLAYKVDEARADPVPVGTRINGVLTGPEGVTAAVGTRREVPAESWGFWLAWLERAPEGLGMELLPITVAVIVLSVSVPVTVLPELPDSLPLDVPVDMAPAGPVVFGGSVSVTVVGVAAQ